MSQGRCFVSVLPEKAMAMQAVLICVSTVFTKQHSIIDVVCGLALVAVWVPVLYRKPKKGM